MHLLRIVPGGMSSRCDRRRSELRVFNGNSRRAVLRQGTPARERRPLGTRNRTQSRTGCALPLREGEGNGSFTMLTAIAFWLFSAVLILAATMVIAARNPVHSVLFLILAFFNAAALFILLGAEFLALILVIVYVGAVAVLFLFVVMMLDIDFAELKRGALQYLPVGFGVGALLFG